MIIAVSELLVSMTISRIALLIEKLEIDFFSSKECYENNSSTFVGKISILIYFLGERLIEISPF